MERRIHLMCWFALCVMAAGAVDAALKGEWGYCLVFVMVGALLVVAIRS